MKKKQFKDESDYDLTHRQIYKAIWAAKLSTNFIREHFVLTEDTHQDGSLRRFYMISDEGYKAIEPHLINERRT